MTDSERAVDYLVLKGWTRTQAAGVVASLMQNAELSPWANAGWRPDRVNLLKDWASANSGRDHAALEVQLAFLDNELRNTYCGVGRKLAAAETVTAAIIAFLPYERPGEAPDPKALNFLNRLWCANSLLAIAPDAADASNARVEGADVP